MRNQVAAAAVLAAVAAASAALTAQTITSRRLYVPECIVVAAPGQPAVESVTAGAWQGGVAVYIKQSSRGQELCVVAIDFEYTTQMPTPPSVPGPAPVPAPVCPAGFVVAVGGNGCVPPDHPLAPR